MDNETPLRAKLRKPRLDELYGLGLRLSPAFCRTNQRGVKFSEVPAGCARGFVCAGLCHHGKYSAAGDCE